jgi:hypothetical protein
VRSHARAASAGSTPRGNGRFSIGVIATMLVCAAAFLGIGAPAASAAPEAQPTFSLKSQFSAEAGGDSRIARGSLAVDGNGYVYLADELGGNVHIYSADPLLGGTYLAEALPAGTNPTEIAIDQITDDLYVQAAGEFGDGTVKRYTSDGKVPPTYTADAGFSVPAGAQIAVDPSTHDLLIADPAAEAVRRYDTTGTLIATIPTPGANPSLLAVAADGSLYVFGGSDVLHLSGTGSAMGAIEDAAPLTALAVDPGSQNLLLYDAASGTLAVYSPAGLLLSTVSTTPADPSLPAPLFTGLAIDGSSGTLYAANIAVFDGGSIFVYAPAVQPGVEPVSVSAVTTTGFHVETEVDPGEEGGGVPDESAVRFEYRPVGSNESWASTPSQEVNAAGAFGADVSGLGPNLTYEVRAVASNSLITKLGGVTKVTTAVSAPGTETNPATDVTETSAVLNGTINPFGLQTSYYFEYGTTTAYGTRVPAGIEAVAGGGHTVQPFFRTVTGLTPGTTYHFRLVATSSAGTAEGPDRTFTTVTAGGIPARAYEQVTPADKQGRAIIPRLSMQASADGNGIAFTKKAGSNASTILVRGLALRGASDWNGDIDLDPPIGVGSGRLLVHPALGVSSDFTHAIVSSDLALTPGAYEHGGNLYRLDIASGDYEFIGGSDVPGTFDSFAYSTSTGHFRAGASDYSWVAFTSRSPLLPGAPSGALYRWSVTDGLEVASVTPNGDMTPSLRSTLPVYQTVSADGSRIYFTAVESVEEGVFLREEGKAPKAISVSHVAGDPAAPQPAVLLGVNEDGRYAFFTSEAKLTDDAPGEEGDLYRYDSADDSLEFLGDQAYVSVGGVVGLDFGSMGISDDGSTIYFVEKNLTGGPLLVWRDGVLHQAFNEWVRPGFERSSPNGRYFVKTEGNGGLSNSAVIQIYDAETNQVSCVSCLPDGTPVPAALPENVGGDTLFSNRPPRAVRNDGSVYFDTAARLVAADVNGTRDVYVYKDGEVTLISPGNRSFDAIIADVSASGNDVFFTTAQKLVGRDNDESIDIYDSRVNGGLPVQNPPPPQECLRDDCKATPNAGPELPFGGSEALSGPGNVNPAKQKKCGKGKRAKKVRGKVRCVKKHKASKNKKGGNR